jgi:hypothetical protein
VILVLKDLKGLKDSRVSLAPKDLKDHKVSSVQQVTLVHKAPKDLKDSRVSLALKDLKDLKAS